MRHFLNNSIKIFLSILIVSISINGISQTTVTLGTATTYSSTAANTPYVTNYEDGNSQYLILASEITAAGGFAGNITSLALNLFSLGSPAMSNFNVKIGNSALTALTTTYASGLTTVYSSTYTPAGTGWQTITFSTPYLWDGTSNIIIQICFDNASWSGRSDVYYSATSFNSHHYGYQDAGTGCAMTAPTNNGVNVNRPNIRLAFVSACATAPATCTNSIYTPANGVEHHILQSWTAVADAENFQYEYSWDGTTWAGTTNTTTPATTSIDWNLSDNPNVTFYTRVRSYKTCGTVQYSSWKTSTPNPIYSACDVPAAPTLSAATATSVSVAIAVETPVVNPAITTYAIHISPAVGGNSWVQASGALGAAAFYQTKAIWATKIVTGLACNTSYTFYADAKNNDGDVRSGSANTASLSTTACPSNVPSSGNNSFTSCALTLYDAGGAVGDYPNSCNGYSVIYPSDITKAVQITGTYVTESVTYDYIKVYNGNGTGGTLLGTYGGTGSIPALTSAGANIPLTIQFISDGSVPNSGFTITTSCVTPAALPGSTCATATAISALPYTATGKTTCGNGNAYTSSNACGSAYMNGEDYLFAYTPTVNQTVIIALTGTSTSTGVFVTNGCPDVGSCVASDVNASGNPTITNLPLTAGVTYYILVSTWPTPNCTPFNISITIPVIPTIADCFVADPVCQATYPYSIPDVNGGSYNELSSATSKGCLTGGEHRTKWYTFTVNTSGDLSFTINSSVDYDWALYNLTTNTCQDIISPGIAPVRCNFSATTGNTGCSSSGTLTSEDASGSVWCSVLPVTTGQVYALLIDNYANNTTGYTLDFSTGAAGIIDVISPALQSVTQIPCGSTSIDVQINKNVLCSSVQASDFTLTGPSSTSYTITTVAGNGAGCLSAGGYERNFNLTISPPIMESGTFTLSLVGGITDVCSHTTTTSTKTFVITGVTASATKIDPSCGGVNDGSITASTAGGTNPFTYSINAGSTWQASQTFSNLSAGSYTVLAKDNNGCSGSAVVNLVSPSTLLAGTIGSSQTICYNVAPAAFTSTTNASGGTGAIAYQWQYTTDPTCSSGWVDISGATSSTYSAPALTQTVCARRMATDNCSSVYSNSITITVNPASVGGTATATAASICSGTSTTITLTSYTGTIQWQSPAGTNIAGATAATYTTPNLNATTSYVAVVRSGAGCVTATSTTATVTVSAALSAGAITGYTPTICYNTSPGILNSNPSGGTGTNTITWYNSSGTNLGTGSTYTAPNITTSTGYYYTLTNTCGTSTPSATVNITVQPNATVIATPPSQTICTGNAPNITLTSGAGAGATFAWTISTSGVSGAIAGNGTSIAQTLTNSAAVSGTATYAVTATANGCSGLPVNVIITVNPKPTLTTVPVSAQTICSGAATNIVLSSNIAGTTYSWAVVQTNVAGGSPGTISPIAQTLTNSGTIAGTAVYTITPTASTCVGTAGTVTVTVNPKPTVTANPTSQSICSGTATNIALTSNVAGATFAWTVAQAAGITGASASSGTPIAQTLSNSLTTSGTATYTITPTASLCSGTPITVVETVFALPSITGVVKNDPATCGANGSITITATGATQYSIDGGTTWAPTNIFTIPAATYYVAVKNANGCVVNWPTAIELNTSGTPYPASAGTDQTKCFGVAASNLTATLATAGNTLTWYYNSISRGTGTPFNPNPFLTAPGTYVFYVTEKNAICEGTGRPVTITINPIPVATATPATQSFCNGGTTSIALSSTVVGTTYNYTFSQTGAAGAANGTVSPIAQTLTNVGAINGTVTYTITPTANTCAGLPITATITVKPTPVVSVTPSPQTICSGLSTGLTLTSTVASTAFTWTVVETGVSGGSGGTGSSINQVLTNSGIVQGTAVYTITSSANSCAGASVPFTVTVNPIPSVTANPPAAQTICTGVATNIALTSNIATATFNWTFVQAGGVTGASNGSGATIAQILTNGGTTPGTATYTITPTANLCAGTPVSVVVTVNPKPNVTATPSSLSICSGANASIVLTSNIGTSSFNWTVAPAGGITGTAPGSGSTISQILTNPGITAANAVYTITPIASGCSGNSTTATVTVNPIPNLSVNPVSLAQTICSGGSTNITLSSTVTTATFSWTVSNSAGVSGAVAGNGSSITQTVNYSGVTSGTATYIVTPAASGCNGTSKNIVVTINPKPNVYATPASDAICSGTAPSIGLTSDVIGTTFTWSAAATGVNGTSNSSGSPIAQTLTCSGTTPGSVTYTVTPSASSCAGTTLPVVITVNPIPVLTPSPALLTICSGTLASIALNSNVINTNYNWTVSAPNITGAGNGSGSSISQTLINTVSATQVATYTVIPTANNCDGVPVNILITVNPSPNVIASPTAQTICSGASTNIGLSSSVTGTTFTWTATESGATGSSNGGGFNIGQTLLSSSTSAGSVNYTITPSANACIGATSNVTVTVNPIPVLTASPLTQTICSGSITGITLNSNVLNTGFAWTVISSGVSGAFNGNGNSIAQTLTNSGTASGTATYNIIPTANSCSGTPVNVAVTVNPIPNVTATPNSATICSGNTTNIVLSSNVPTATYSWTFTNSSANISGSSASSGNPIAQTLNNSGTTIETVTYHITPTAASCAGTIVDVVITVNPKPNVTAAPQTICSGGTTNIGLTSNVTGTTFSWTISQSGVSGATADNGLAIAQTLINSGTNTGTVTYTITPLANGCMGIPTNVLVTVNPLPVFTATPSAQTICSGTAPSVSLGSSVSGTTFNWTVNAPNITGATNGSGISITQTLTNTATTTQTATYSVTPTASSCPGTTTDVVITVNPKPVVTANPTAETICSNDTTNIALSSNVTGTTFAWTILQTGVTGATTGSVATISQVLTNLGITPGTVSYTITPTAAGCNGNNLIVVETVNPLPVITDTNRTDVTICGANNGIISIVATGFPTLTYSIDGGNTFSASNSFNSLSPGSYSTVVMNGYNCTVNGPSIIIGTTGTPYPATAGSDQTICDGIIATNLTATAGSAGALKWYSDPSLTSQIGSGTTFNPNPYLVIGSNEFYVTETTTCEGTGRLVTITVNPIPVAIATPSTQTLCSNGTTSIALTSITGGTSFSWTAATASANISGFTDDSGIIISNTLVNSGTAPDTVIYHITPVASSCNGLVLDVEVIVNPIPDVIFTPASQSICSGNLTSIGLSSSVTGTSYTWTVSAVGISGASNGSGNSIAQTLSNSSVNPSDATYTVTPLANSCLGIAMPVVVTVNPIPNATATPSSQVVCSGGAWTIALNSSVSGANFSWIVTPSTITGAANGNGLSISQPLTNTTVTPGTVTYAITPSANNCDGNTINASVTVNPIPVIAANPALETICSNNSTNINLTSPIFGTTFTWTVIPSAVTGANAGNGNNIIQNLINANANPDSVIYTIGATAGNCAALPIDVVVHVISSPDVVATPVIDSICSGDTTAILLSSTVSGITFNWTVNAPLITGASAGSGSSIAQILMNTGTNIKTAIYQITPSVSTCSGMAINIPVVVKPLPNVNITPITQNLCSGDVTTISLSSNVMQTTYQWTATEISVSGASNSSGSFIADVLTNSGFLNGTATYSVTPTSRGCQGNAGVATVTVYPVPNIITSPTDTTICSGENVQITLSSNVIGTLFNWTASAPGITGALNGSGTPINITLGNSGINPATATYTVTTNANGCAGNSTPVTILVNPIPHSNAGPDQTITFGANTTLDGAGSGMGLNITYNWQPADSLVSGITTIAPQTKPLTSTTTFTIMVSDTITGCSSTDNVIITVSGLPLSVISITPTQTICRGDTAHLTVTANGGSGTYLYQWSSSPAGFSATTQAVSVYPTITTTYYVTINDGFNIIDTSVLVNVNQPPVVIVSTQVPLCAGSDTVTLVGGNPLGGTYSGNGVSFGEFIPTVAGVGTHTITYIYTNGNGCTNSDTATITVNPSPTVTLSAFAPVCANASNVVLNGGLPLGGTYSGTGVIGNTFIPSNAGAGAHTITYTYTNSTYCTDSITNMIVVNQVPTAIITATTDATCNGIFDGTATVTGSSGTQPYHYLWDNSPADTVAIADGLHANQTYHVTVSDVNNCQVITQTSVSEPDVIVATTTTVSTTCGNANGTAVVNAIGGTLPYSYNWQNLADTTNTIDSLSAGNYTVTVTDANGCIKSTTAAIATSVGLQAVVSIINETCFGSANGSLSATATGTAPYQYMWSTLETTAAIDSLSAGIYSLTITDANNCILTDTVSVSSPAMLSVTLSATNIVCKGDPSGSIAVVAQGGSSPYTPIWSTGATTNSVTGGANTYCVTITDANGCTKSGCGAITEPALALVVTNNDSITKNVICWGGSNGSAGVKVVGGVQPYTYLWSTNPIQTTISISNLPVNSAYIVTVTDSIGCNKSFSIVITQPTKIELDTNAIIKTPASCEEGDDGRIEVVAIGGMPPYTYIWYTDPEQNNSYATGLKPNDYEIKVTDSKGCYQSFTIPLKGIEIPCLDIPTAFTPNGDDAHDKWKIKNLHLYPKAKIDVFNRWGSMIYSADASAEPWDGKYNGHPVPNGVYIFIINLNNGTDPKQGTITIIR